MQEIQIRPAATGAVSEGNGLLRSLGVSPQDPDMLHVAHAQVQLELNVTPEAFFNAYSR